MKRLQQHPKGSNSLSQVTFPRSHSSLCWLAAVEHKRVRAAEAWNVRCSSMQKRKESAQLHLSLPVTHGTGQSLESSGKQYLTICVIPTPGNVYDFMSTYKEICTHSDFIGGQNYILWGFFKPRLHPAVTRQWAAVWWNILALRKKALFADVSPTEINLSRLFQPPLNIYTKQGDSSYDNCLWQRHNPSVWQVTNSLWGRFLLN